MRIAQIAPPDESVPPLLYGGTERVVHWLTEELVRRGHDVTLFATADSKTKARLVPTRHKALRLDPNVSLYAPHYINIIGQVMDVIDEFDIIHSHLDIYTFPIAHHNRHKVVMTCHGRLDIPDIHPLFWRYRTVPLVSISYSQRKPMPWANWIATVYHGLPIEDYPMGDGSGGYLAFLGRISPEKRPDLAIEVAKKVGIPLKIAAKIDNADREYYEAKIAPLMDHPLVEYIGEIDDSQKPEFLGKAIALLMPVDWPEPFGLVAIEAMACGTPVVARPMGALPEIVSDGVTGYLALSVEELAKAVEKIHLINRSDCREHVAQRFNVQRMARDYERVYETLISKVPKRVIKPAA